MDMMHTMRMNLKSITCSLSLLAGTSSAWADMPKVLDHVPKDAALVATIDNIGGFEKKLEKWSETMGIFENAISLGGDNPIEQIKSITGTAGLNKSASAAFFAIKKPQAEINAAKAKDVAEKAAKGVVDAAKQDADSHDDDADMTDEEFNDSMIGDDAEDRFEQMMDPFMLIPVSDYAAFVKALGANGSEGIMGTKGIVEIKIDDEQAFAKDIGQGYALLSKEKAPLERIAVATLAGNMNSYTQAMGVNGKNISDRADVMLIANIPMLQADIQEGMKMLEDGAGNQIIPGMEQAKQAFEMMKVLGENFARDASVGIAGLGLGEGGMWIDLGTQFKNGSELAGLFQEKGDTNRLLSRLPQQEFLLATVMDTAAPNIKKMIGEYIKMSAKMMDGAAAGNPQQAEMAKAMQRLFGPFSDMTAHADKSDGVAMVMGSTPGGLMGGLFVNTIAYTETKQPAQLGEALKKAFTASPNGEKIGPITIKTTYKENSDEFAGVKVSKWGMQMQADPNDPEGTQVAMMSGFIFGPRGLGGYIGQVENGFVTSYSDNKLLMTNALEVAKSGKGLSLDADLILAQSVLPANRTVEFHIGVKPILETVQGFAGMMGGGGDWEVPEKVSPISMGITTYGGGMHTRIYVPNDVVSALKEMAKSLEGVQADMMNEEPVEGESPDF